MHIFPDMLSLLMISTFLRRTKHGEKGVGVHILTAYDNASGIRVLFECLLGYFGSFVLFLAVLYCLCTVLCMVCSFQRK